MFPIRDHNPSGHSPYVTWALIVANIIVFIISLPFMENNAALASFWDTWAMIPAEIMVGVDYHTALTSMFLHGGILHIAGNMLFLWIFGDNVEDKMGHVPFLIFYLLCGFGAGLFHILSDPASGIPIVGASGAVAGIMGAYLLLYPNAKIDVVLIIVIFFKVFKWPAWVVLGAWMAIQTFSGLAFAANSGVAYWAHIGGFIVGALMAVPLWLRLGGTEYWQKTNYHPPHAPTFETRTSTIPIVRRRR